MAVISFVMFDFDGTLVDTAPDIVRATNMFLAQKGISPLPEARIRGEIGMGLRQLLRDVFPKADLSAAELALLHEEFTAVYEREYLTSPTLFPGAWEFLNEFGGQIAIVSNKRERFIRPMLAHLGLDRLAWSSIVGGDTLPQMKPHPLPFLHAMAQAGANPEESVLVGDGIPDVMGAVALGLPCVAVDFGYTDGEELMALGAHTLIEHYDQLLPKLIRLEEDRSTSKFQGPV